jgi:hypothetical protein
MLALVLLGLSLGGALASRLCRSGGRPGLIRAFYLAAGGWVVFSYAAFPWVQNFLAGADDGRSRLLVAMCAFLMLPICVLSGAQFGLIGQALHGRVRHSVQSTGLLTLANTLGAAVGPLLSAFVLLPFLGGAVRGGGLPRAGYCGGDYAPLGTAAGAGGGVCRRIGVFSVRPDAQFVFPVGGGAVAGSNVGSRAGGDLRDVVLLPA